MRDLVSTAPGKGKGSWEEGAKGFLRHHRLTSLLAERTKDWRWPDNTRSSPLALPTPSSHPKRNLRFGSPRRARLGSTRVAEIFEGGASRTKWAMGGLRLVGQPWDSTLTGVTGVTLPHTTLLHVLAIIAFRVRAWSKHQDQASG